MKKSILPNLITIFRFLILIPLAGYFMFIGRNYLTFLIGTLNILLDILDGNLARKNKSVSRFGAVADATADATFICIIALMALYKAYFDLWIILFIAIHRLTRLYPTVYFWKLKKAFYIPLHMKAPGFILMAYIYMVPLFVEVFGQIPTYNISLIIIIGSYIPLLLSVIRSITDYKKGEKLKFQ